MRDKLKIALLAPVWIRIPPESYGGIEIVVSLLADGLVDRGHDVTLFASGDSITRAKLVSVYDKPQKDRIGWVLPDIFHAASAFDYCRREGFDIIHDHMGFSGVALGLGSATPVLSTLHGEFNELTRPFYERFKDAVYYNAISEYQKRCAPELRYVNTVYNAIDFGSYPVQTKKSGYLLALSRLSPSKGAHLAIQAAKKLNRRLIIAGKLDAGDDTAYFEKMIEPYVDDRQICFLGEVSEERKRELMAGADCFVFPIQWDEPFGLVMLEAMAAGTPVVAFNRGAASEVIAPGLSGYIVETFDEMVGMIDAAAGLDPLACRQWAESQFSIGRMIDGYIDNYWHILRAEGRIAQPLTLA
ncbi:MAG: glycosyltransferase family 4 protein [Actinomycetota bacterium]|nr:glycosyltransferase family 4 protein [Actinomycetota bacterium]